MIQDPRYQSWSDVRQLILNILSHHHARRTLPMPMIAANTNASTNVEPTSSPGNESPFSSYNDEPPDPVQALYWTLCPGGLEREKYKDLDRQVDAQADNQVGG